ncbi:ribonuclease H-like domain-containing protein [Tanacetum coccineum]
MHLLLTVDLSETYTCISHPALLIHDILTMFVFYRDLCMIIDSLHKEFDMTDLGALNYFLGISVVRHSTVDNDSKWVSAVLFSSGSTLYRSLAGGLRIYFTRPDLSYARLSDLGLHFISLATTSFVGLHDADWAVVFQRFLGGNSSSGIKKYRGLNSNDGGNTGDGVKIAGGVIESGDEIEFSKELKELLPNEAGIESDETEV